MSRKLNFLRACSYAVTALCASALSGTCETFTNPVVSSGADPWVVFHEGYYYFTFTTGANVQVRAATQLCGSNGLSQAVTKAVFNAPAPYNQHVWAPELHFLRGKAYLYYAADDGPNANHRMFVAESVKTGPTFSFIAKGRIYDRTTDRWAIDGTVLEATGGSLYFVWSGWPGTQDGLQNLYIAPMSDPLTISGPRVLLSTPSLPWESWIMEGPEILQRNGMVFIIYAANRSWTDDECLGALVNRDGDFLNPKSWTKLPAPVFSTHIGPSGAVYGPGHCSFTRSLDGEEDWIVYHAAKTEGSGWDRSIRMQRFSWTTDGLPSFGYPVPVSVPLPIPSGDRYAPSRITRIVTQEDRSLRIGVTAPLPLQTNTWSVEASPDLSSWRTLTNLPGQTYSAEISEPTSAGSQFYRLSSERRALTDSLR